jgi:hypothetical protein
MMAAAAAAVFVIVAVFRPLTPAYDVEVFLRAGKALLHDMPVYPRPGTPAVYSGFSFVYPFVTAWPFVPLAALSTSLGVAVFFGLSVAAVVAAALIGSKRDFTAVVLVLCTAYTITGLQLGSLSPLLFAGTVFLWRLRDRPAAFGVLAACVVASKLFLAPLLLWPLLAGRRRAFAWGSCCTVAALALGFVLGPIGPHAYSHMLSQLGAHEAQSGFSLTGAIMTAGLGFTAAELAAAAIACAVLITAYVGFRRLGNEHVLLSGAAAASLIASPVVWSHYLVLLAAPFLAMRAKRRWLLALAVASWIISPPHGLTIHVQASQGVTSHGAWLALGITLAVFVFALGVPRRSAAAKPSSGSSPSAG